MNENYCKYCNRYFQFKDLYERHNVTCEFYYKRARERDREKDLLETVPSSQDQFQVIQHLMYEVSQLKKQVSRLQQNNIVKKKKMIQEYLNGDGLEKPEMCFEDWTKQLTANFDDLQQVFEGYLSDGILSILLREIKSRQCPLLAFVQKQNTFYIYTCKENQTSWRTMTHQEYEKMYDRLAHKLLQEFLKWQIAFAEQLSQSEKLKEQNINYMYKINGCGKSNEEKGKSELKRILFHKIAKDFTQNTVYEYV